jgi:hypothetical protein
MPPTVKIPAPLQLQRGLPGGLSAPTWLACHQTPQNDWSSPSTARLETQQVHCANAVPSELAPSTSLSLTIQELYRVFELQVRLLSLLVSAVCSYSSGASAIEWCAGNVESAARIVEHGIEQSPHAVSHLDLLLCANHAPFHSRLYGSTSLDLSFSFSLFSRSASAYRCVPYSVLACCDLTDITLSLSLRGPSCRTPRGTSSTQ